MKLSQEDCKMKRITFLTGNNFYMIYRKGIHIHASANSNDNSFNDDMDDQGGLLTEVDKPKLKRPAQYQVVMNNDDYTPMEFVVSVLQHFFQMDREKATQTMLTVHTKGKAVCGVYPKDIAETKAMQVNQCAQDNEHPLQCHIEAISDED